MGIYLKTEVKLLVNHLPESLIFYPGPQFPTPLVIQSCDRMFGYFGGVFISYVGIICTSSLFAGQVTTLLIPLNLRPDAFQSSTRFASQLASFPLKLDVSCPLAMMARRIYSESCYNVPGLRRWRSFQRVTWDSQTHYNEVNFVRVNIYLSLIIGASK